MRILLTGASGFIGSAFYSRYRKILDIETASFHNEIDQIGISRIDVVVHLAALVHQMNGADEKAYYEINVAKTLSLANKAKASGVRQFIFMSSVKVYGEESDAPYNEESPCFPKEPYGESKLLAEKALLALADDTFKIAVVRTPVVYGEGVKANILKLVELTDRYRILPFGGIDNRRSMVYVGNLTHLLFEIVRQEKEGLFLAGDDEPLSTSSLITQIAEALEKKCRLFSFMPLKILLKVLKPQLYQRLYGDLYLDNAQTKAVLNLTNPYSTQQGIERMVAWYKGQKQ
jgi:UDP-glucose 4-epimerase